MASDDIFECIRERSRFVTTRAKHVHVVTGRIDDFARALPIERLRSPALDGDHHFVGDASTTLAYFITLDAVNFGSGYFPCLAKRPGMSGHYTLASSLTDRFRDLGPLTAEELASIDGEACAALFCQDSSDPVIAELMGLFARAWNDLGLELIARFGGSFAALIEGAAGSAGRLVSLLDRQAYFHDVASYEGTEVPFYKRAQILASDLALAFGGTGYGRFDDLDRLTLFADNLVPHVLRVDGLLVYDRDLTSRIERQALIPSGSEEEVEIRACALDTVERIAERLSYHGTPVTARELDVHLWLRGQDPAYKQHSPRHRTRTVYY
jgi:hypothetical protein